MNTVNAFKIIFVSTALAAGLSGCSTAMPPKPRISSSYSADCTVCAYVTVPDSGEETEFTFGGTIRRLGTGFWEMELNSPETLAGMKLSSAGEVLSSELYGLSTEISAEDIPDNSPVMALFTALDSAALSDEGLTEGSGGWSLNSENYTIIFDDSGCPISMAISNPKLTAEFEGFTESGLTLGAS